MLVQRPPGHRPRLRRWWRRLDRWQRMVVAAVLLGMALLSAGLIYVGPIGHLLPVSGAAAPRASATDAPFYPPGTRYYYRRGQWLPLDQQEPTAP